MSDEADLPEDVRAFLRAFIESHEELAILRFLQLDARGAHEARSAEIIAARVELSTSAARAALQALQARGLVQSQATASGTTAYQARRSADGIVERTVQAYRDRQAAVVHALAQNAVERVRSAVAGVLAPGRKRAERS